MILKIISPFDLSINLFSLLGTRSLFVWNIRWNNLQSGMDGRNSKEQFIPLQVTYLRSTLYKTWCLPKTRGMRLWSWLVRYVNKLLYTRLNYSNLKLIKTDRLRILIYKSNDNWMIPGKETLVNNVLSSLDAQYMVTASKHKELRIRMMMFWKLWPAIVQIPRIGQDRYAIKVRCMSFVHFLYYWEEVIFCVQCILRYNK